MRKDIRRRLDAHVRTSDVCARHRAMFDATDGGRNMRAALVTCVAEVEQQLVLQEQCTENRRSATAQLVRARRVLRDCANAIVRVGRVVQIDGVTMGTMRLPGSIGDGPLLAYMRGLLDRVAPYEDAFVATGLLPGLLRDCTHEIDRFVAAKHSLAQARQQFTASTKTMLRVLERAGRAIDVLESIAIHRQATIPEVLPALRTARRIGPRSNRAADPAAATAVSTSSVTAMLPRESRAEKPPAFALPSRPQREFIVVRALARAFTLVLPGRPTLFRFDRDDGPGHAAHAQLGRPLRVIAREPAGQSCNRPAPPRDTAVADCSPPHI